MVDFDPGEKRPNPQSIENQQRIISAWDRLKANIQRARGEVPLDGGENLLLRYSTSVPPVATDLKRIIHTDIYEQVDFNVGDDYARGDYYFYQAEDPNVIAVTFGLDTDKERQSQGYGTGLFGLVNKVVEDALERFPEMFQGKTVVGGIVDKSNRPNWTSSQAEKIGYERDSNGVWCKVYQGTGSNLDTASIKRFRSMQTART